MAILDSADNIQRQITIKGIRIIRWKLWRLSVFFWRGKGKFVETRIKSIRNIWIIRIILARYREMSAKVRIIFKITVQLSVVSYFMSHLPGKHNETNHDFHLRPYLRFWQIWQDTLINLLKMHF